MEWQPIETAPKDVAIIVSDNEHIAIAAFSEPLDMDLNGEWWTTDKWGEDCASGFLLDEWTPLFWMPLPDAPGVF
jgi:hypothetical protein